MSNVKVFERRPEDRTTAPRRCIVVEQFEADLADVVPVLGVACEAAAELRRRFCKRQVYVGQRDPNGFLGVVGFVVALAAVQRGHQPAEALELSRRVSVEILRRYKGVQIYFPVRDDREVRNAWIQAVYCPVNAEMVQRETGLTHQRLHQLRGEGSRKRTSPVRKAG